ncbi:glycoside hydrolase family 35 protein [Streptomyces sp. AHA2]|uniref:glycoside hydrolase family 35 protein n=1 Tax=Streptomyces sp. AHA2 TaxID=3064526 RepID=UPI002FE320B4
MELSRRTFHALAGTAALGFALTGSGSPSSAHPGRPVRTGPPPPVPGADGRPHDIRFDRHSLVVDGRRLVLWAGEMHPFRLPSPSLWRDVLQKMRAHGYNAVTACVAWNVHSPAPGRYDFSGVRDLDLFLRTAAETGLYVVLRPGPHIGADVDAGGFPGWLTATEGRARTSDPAFLRYADEWLTAVNGVVAGHLFTRGTGTVLLYRLEQAPAAADDPSRRAYLSHLYEKVRADGIDVPLFHTTEEGRPAEPDEVAPVRGHFAGGGATSPGRTPRFLPDVGGGRPDVWGGSALGGKGYAEARRTRDAAWERRTYLSHLADGVTLHNVRMTYGGTSWGWLPAPAVYTSYDYGAAFDEARNATPKLASMHQIGQLLRSVPDLARLDPGREVRAADERIEVRHLTNPDTGAHVYVLRNDTDEPVTSTLPDAGIDVPVTVPARDAKLIAAGLRLGRRTMVHCSVQPMLSMTAGRQDIAVFAGRRGDLAQVVLDCADEPTPMRLDAEPAWAYNLGKLNVSAPLGAGGLSRVRVEGDGVDTPMLLLFADDATALRLWPHETPSGPLLVYGPALLRSAVLRDSTVHLTGDTIGATGLEVWGPRGITHVTWNGRPVPTRLSASGSLLALRPLPGVTRPVLPALTGWRRRAENPEAEPGFDDAAWAKADRTTSFSTTPVPDGQPVLFADDYGFHYGDVWYRGEWTGGGTAESVSLSYSTGTQGLLMAWLDGEPLGTHRMPVPDEGRTGQGTWTAKAVFALPEDVRERLRDEPRARHVLSVLVRPMQHDTDEGARDTHKAARGLTAVTFRGASPEVTWRIQGATVPDPVRGAVNNGGLYGEREGWHLPDHDDRDWERAGPPRADRRQGVTWYRTRFRLDVDPGVDASVGLVLDDDPERAYRVQVFLNGWNLGQYLNDVGPQHTFVLPNGILRTRGANTLALAVLSDGTTASGPGQVRLTLLGAAAGGVPVKPV